MNISPFELDLGWNPKSPLDLLTAWDGSVEAVNDIRKILLSATQDAMFAQRLAQSRQAAYNQKKYRPPTYQIGDEIWLSRKHFTGSFSKTQKSKKLGVKRFGPFKIIELIGKNAVRLSLPSSIRVHPVFHLGHISRVFHQPTDISQPSLPRPPPISQQDGTSLIYIDKILKHRKRGQVYQWLAAKTGAPLYKAEWQPTKDFLENDGTLTEALHDYICKHNLLPHLHNIVADDNEVRSQW